MKKMAIKVGSKVTVIDDVLGPVTMPVVKIDDRGQIWVRTDEGHVIVVHRDMIEKVC